MTDKIPTQTPGPWSWWIHDFSMASLVGPSEEEDHVLSVSPCKSCQEHAVSMDDKWRWGRCRSPNEADASLIAAAPEMLAALLNVRALISEAAATGFNWKDGDWTERLFASQQMTSAAIKKASP